MEWNEGPYIDGYDPRDENRHPPQHPSPTAPPPRRDRCRSPVPDRVGNLTVRPVFFHHIDWSAVRLFPKQEGGTHQCAV